MGQTLSAAQPHACHYEAEEKNIRPFINTTIHTYTHTFEEKEHKQLTEGSQKSCNIYTSKHYVYMCKACVHGVHTHLLGNVETLSGVYLSVEKVNCIRE